MKPAEWNKIAKDYYKEILSPLKNSRSNPLLRDLKKIKSKSKTVIGLGCGIGELEPLLSKYFKQVTAIDFSEEMINQAKKRHPNLKNISFKVQDFSDLSKYKNKFDIAISINSLINPKLKELDKQLKQIHSTLKTNGIFLGILPAMEVYVYQAQILKQKDPSLLTQFTNSKEHNFPLGITNFEGKQKNFYRFEILWRFEKAGFKNINVSKVLYPWKEFKEAGQTSFPNEPEPWDWYIKCEK